MQSIFGLTFELLMARRGRQQSVANRRRCAIICSHTHGPRGRHGSREQYLGFTNAQDGEAGAITGVSPDAASSDSGGRGSEVQLSELEDEEREDHGRDANSSSSLEGARHTCHQPPMPCSLSDPSTP